MSLNITTHHYPVDLVVFSFFPHCGAWSQATRLLQITTPFLLKNTTAYKLRQVLHYYDRIIRNDESYYKLNTNLADLLMVLGIQQL